MKKSSNRIKVLIIACFFVTIISSCNKEKDIISDSQTSAANINPALKQTDASLRTLYATPCLDPLGNVVSWIVFGCWWPANNCLPTTYVSSSSMEKANENFINNFNNNTIDEFFKGGDYLTLFPELKKMTEVVNGLVSSNIILFHEIGKDDGLDYYIGLPKEIKYLSDWKGREKCVLVVDNHKE